MRPLEFRSDIQALVIQKQSATVDGYQAARSAEQFGKTLSKVVYSASFLESVLNAHPDLRSAFASDPALRREQWAKHIEATVVPETGIIRLAAYDRDQAMATRLVQAIAAGVVDQGASYIGGGDWVEIRVIDTPLTSKYPVRPNLAMTVGGGFVAGLMAAFIYLVIDAESQMARERNRNVLPVTTPTPVRPVEAWDRS